mmetsp:Transcript_11262/g.14068  ORF Transcript_11262/g.14068 Transcript_11262/m.14068 type:complete len:408 (+) Transcript_11262:53-1276(+)|eukprot:CAMPEP_0204827932 /NCGR_PEP_ID=MMETSP1346-20131115/5471_1 /ASSEMBLY_ACC=CAM_ASM_000771 /TAXON_ID=215587 /ORGANISM="Aplanochytrium stocchinoi, Strain GSBS06" /LENGTH=407 /DNA_ID=CAMNT_0051956629 /DNA_START=99 /DNA_END=1322 /DNA_ORIENTATION=+
MCGRSRICGDAITYASVLASDEPTNWRKNGDEEGVDSGSGNDENSTKRRPQPVVDENSGAEFFSCENCMPGRATPIVVAVYNGDNNVKDEETKDIVDVDIDPLKRYSKRKRSLMRARWGLIPSYTKPDVKPDFFRMNNARVERVDQVHRNSIKKKRRCVVVVDGFYEWKTTDAPYSKSGKIKQPYYIYRKDGRPLMFSGLYDYYYNAHKEKIATYTIITVPVNESLKWLHHRMPAVLSDEIAAMTWLHHENWEVCKRLLMPEEQNALTWHPVTTKLNKATYQGDDCTQSIKLKQPKSISSFFGKGKYVKSEDNSQSATTENIVKLTTTTDIKSESLKPKSLESVSVDINIRKQHAESIRDIEPKYLETYSSKAVSISSPSKMSKRKIKEGLKLPQKDITSYFTKRMK